MTFRYIERNLLLDISKFLLGESSAEGLENSFSDYNRKKNDIGFDGLFPGISEGVFVSLMMCIVSVSRSNVSNMLVHRLTRCSEDLLVPCSGIGYDISSPETCALQKWRALSLLCSHVFVASVDSHVKDKFMKMFFAKASSLLNQHLVIQRSLLEAHTIEILEQTSLILERTSYSDYKDLFASVAVKMLSFLEKYVHSEKLSSSNDTNPSHSLIAWICYCLSLFYRVSSNELVIVTIEQCSLLISSSNHQIQSLVLQIIRNNISHQLSDVPSESSSDKNPKLPLHMPLSARAPNKALSRNSSDLMGSPPRKKEKVLSSSSASKLPISPNPVASIVQTSANRIIWVDELFRSGLIRSIYWMQLHEQGSVRSTACSIVEAIYKHHKEAIIEQDGHAKVKRSSELASKPYELWASFIEQGVVAIADYIMKGTTTDVRLLDQFPEACIRNQSSLVLDLISLGIKEVPNMRKRLMNALAYSGHQKLLQNVFTGIVILSRRDAAIGNLLWAEASPATGHVPKVSAIDKLTVSGRRLNNQDMPLPKGMMADALRIALTREADSIISFLRLVTILSAQNLAACHITDTDATFTPINKFDDSEVLVTIRDSDGTDVKMVCPKLSVIASNSATLALKIEQTRLTGTEIILEGSYSIWQEVFSQMSSDYLFETSVDGMDDSSLLNSLRVLLKNRVISLFAKYVPVLERRLCSVSVYQIFDEALICLEAMPWLSNDVDLKRLRVASLQLCQSCIAFVIQNNEIVQHMKSGRSNLPQLISKFIKQELFHSQTQ